MKTNGIRILDGNNDVLEATLADILQELPNGNSYNWLILFLDGTPRPGQGHYLTDYEKKINQSENGLLINWKDLIKLSDKFSQMFEAIILGCKNIKHLRRYEKEEEMYQTCDIVLDLIDCAFWEVYSKDRTFLDKLKEKFREIEVLGIW